MKLSILILEILGTFLLSIEAIKIENFKNLTKFLTRSNQALNPEIKWQEETKKKETIKNPTSTFFLISIAILFYPPSFVILSFLLNVNLGYIFLLSALGTFVLWTVVILINE